MTYENTKRDVYGTLGEWHQWGDGKRFCVASAQEAVREAAGRGWKTSAEEWCLVPDDVLRAEERQAQREQADRDRPYTEYQDMVKTWRDYRGYCPALDGPFVGRRR